MSVTRFDSVTINPAKRTAEGFILDTAIVTRAGVFDYADPTMPGGIRKELRHPDDVFAATHLDSMRGKPITFGHVEGLENGRSDAVMGPDGKPWRSVGSMLGAGQPDEAANVVRADLSIHHVEAVDKHGLRELSLGYALDYDPTPGIWNGERYDGRQTNLRVSHVAFVKRGRAGVARINMDSADDVPFAEPHTEHPMVQVRLDNGISYDAPAEIAAAFEATRTAVAEHRARADAAEGVADTLRAEAKKAADALPGLIEAARADARARLDMEDVARGLGITELPESARDLRIAVIRKVNGDGFSCAGRSDDYVEAAYDMAVARADNDRRTDNARRQQGTPTDAGNVVKQSSDAVSLRQDAYDANLARLSDAWKN